ncbi:MAG: sulfotransferase [Proteobacteria bacterium]|nr:sulfotransferase [Pseudomonadota bacterium]
MTRSTGAANLFDTSASRELKCRSEATTSIVTCFAYVTEIHHRIPSKRSQRADISIRAESASSTFSLSGTGEMLTNTPKTLIRALFGPSGSGNLKKGAIRASADLAARLQDALARISPETRECDEQPILLLSAGWRSGSTLLQRMIMEHNRDMIMWGEPFDHSNMHDHMAHQFRSFTTQWPFERFFLSKRASGNLADEWVANLYPDVDYLLKAHRSFFDAIFGEPGRAIGRGQWGVKEVRLTIDHATYFRALYPKCKIVLLYRNPLDAYASFRRLQAGWFWTWPDDLVKTPYAFGRHWAKTTRGFMEGHQRVSALLIRYEDLDNPAEVNRLADYLGWPVSRSSNLQRRDIGESPEKRGRLPWFDRFILTLVTGETQRAAGY